MKSLLSFFIVLLFTGLPTSYTMIHDEFYDIISTTTSDIAYFTSSDPEIHGGIPYNAIVEVRGYQSIGNPPPLPNSDCKVRVAFVNEAYGLIGGYYDIPLTGTTLYEYINPSFVVHGNTNNEVWIYNHCTTSNTNLYQIEVTVHVEEDL